MLGLKVEEAIPLFIALWKNKEEALRKEKSQEKGSKASKVKIGVGLGNERSRE